MSACLRSLGSAFACVLLALPAHGQDAKRPAVGVDAGTTIQGRIVRLQGPDRFIVQTREGKEVTLYAAKDARFRMNDRAIRYSDLRVGANVQAAYTRQGDRFVVDTVTVREAAAAPDREVPDRKVDVEARERSVQGQITAVRAPDHITVRSKEDGEMSFQATPTTRIQVNGKEARFTDLRIGMNISATLTVQDGRLLASSITVGAATAAGKPAAKDTVLEGTVVRVVGEDQIILRADGREVPVYVGPKTVYTFDERPGRFVDVRPGAQLRVNYDVRDRRNFARSIFGLRRPK